jgi:Zinc finger, C3HC4 type (RING finger)
MSTLEMTRNYSFSFCDRIFPLFATYVSHCSYRHQILFLPFFHPPSLPPSTPQAARDVALTLSPGSGLGGNISGGRAPNGSSPHTTPLLNSSTTFATSHSAASATASASTPAPPLKGPQPVNQADLLEALHSLLGRVGLSPSLQETELLSKIIELENSTKRLQVEVSNEGRLLGEARQSLSEAENAKRCTICATGTVSHVLVPCGHVLCEECVGKLQTNRKCYFCRKNIDQKIRFYLQGDEKSN